MLIETDRAEAKKKLAENSLLVMLMVKDFLNNLKSSSFSKNAIDAAD